MRQVKGGTTTAVLADGPRGPARRAKPGVVALARGSGRPITPVAFSCRPAIRFRSWDGTLLPLPFARVLVAFAEPIAAPNELTRPDRELIRTRVEDTLEALTHECDLSIGSTPARA